MENNESQIGIISLSGVKDIKLRHAVFFFSVIVYILIIILNVILLMTILLDKSLHEPMYFFLCNLCVNTLYGTTGFYPKFIYDLLSFSYFIPRTWCSIQSFVIYTSYMCEFTTLVAMAYDRYVAICRPLEYHTILTHLTVIKLIIYSWTVPIISAFPQAMFAAQLPLCGSHIDRLFCDNWSILKLSCVPTTANNIYGLILLFGYMSHSALVLYSYQRLVVACQKSKDNRKKFMQTCMPHLLAVMNFTVAVLFDVMFSRYGSSNFLEHLRNFLQIEILVIPPLFNPLIYGLNLSEVRKRLFQHFKKLGIMY